MNQTHAFSGVPPQAFFRAYDIRGVVDGGFDPALVQAIGHALGSEAVARGVEAIAVGRDGRLSGPALAEGLMTGLQAAGLEVIDVGAVPTPLLYFAAHTLAGGSGVMVTGSHNPPNYNGLKMMLVGETLAGETIQELRRRIVDGDLVQGAGGRRSTDVAEAYIARITEDIELARPLKVVVDAGNGVAGAVAPALLRRLGCEVVELFCEVDGTFPNHHPDPSQPENLADLIAAVAEHGADLGLAFDGDGDRLGVIAPDGTVIWPDRLMMLYARDLLARHPGAEILYDVKCTANLEQAIREAGGRPQMWCTGHSLIKKRMREGGSLLAGEMSGHIFFKERWYGFDDALYAAARLLEIVSREADIGALFHALPDALNTPELRVEMAEGEHYAYMERLAARAGELGDGRLTTVDGLRVDFDDGWGLVRASNTTPSLILRFEAADAAALERIQGRFRRLMLELDGGLTLPF